MEIVCLVDCGIGRRPRCCRDEKTRVTIWGGRTTRWTGARTAGFLARGFRGNQVRARPVNSTVGPTSLIEKKDKPARGLSLGQDARLVIGTSVARCVSPRSRISAGEDSSALPSGAAQQIVGRERRERVS